MHKYYIQPSREHQRLAEPARTREEELLVRPVAKLVKKRGFVDVLPLAFLNELRKVEHTRRGHLDRRFAVIH